MSAETVGMHMPALVTLDDLAAFAFRGRDATAAESPT
jgi:hypothetical protein